MSDAAPAAARYQLRICWQEMTACPAGALVLTRNAAREVFGVCVDGVWHELVDGDEIALPHYQPDEWTYVTEAMRDDYML